MLKVIVGGRRHGRTTALCRWLLQGHMIDQWPDWSRVLVVANQAVKSRTMIRLRQVAATWSDSDAGHAVAGLAPALVRADCGPNGLAAMAGFPNVEYAIDDLDLLLAEMLAERLGTTRMPDIVTITGHSVALGSSLHGDTPA